MHWEKSQLVAMVTNGVSSITFIKQGLMTWMRNNISHLFGINCITHKDVLVARDLPRHFLTWICGCGHHYNVYEWVERALIKHKIYNLSMQRGNPFQPFTTKGQCTKYIISNGNNKMVCMPNFGWGKHQWCEDGFFLISLHLSSGGFKWLTYISD